jgi:hypothetical protein
VDEPTLLPWANWRTNVGRIREELLNELGRENQSLLPKVHRLLVELKVNRRKNTNWR